MLAGDSFNRKVHLGRGVLLVQHSCGRGVLQVVCTWMTRIYESVSLAGEKSSTSE